jgi:hypothetical protein
MKKIKVSDITLTYRKENHNFLQTIDIGLTFISVFP